MQTDEQMASAAAVSYPAPIRKDPPCREHVTLLEAFRVRSLQPQILEQPLLNVQLLVLYLINISLAALLANFSSCLCSVIPRPVAKHFLRISVASKFPCSEAFVSQ
ncbi:hypothetical protein ALC53_02684 [Atta colombica]|uniref:Uncharacterized protein n=1 Tax=Atta colombica TaxID=520822 RepID=A0A195BQP6_9HYME|nr:hypothetical protein ALC53_02684 [Atta colombica]